MGAICNHIREKMKRRIKSKLLSATVATTMVVSFLTVPSFATGTEQTDEVIDSTIATDISEENVQKKECFVETNKDTIDMIQEVETLKSVDSESIELIDDLGYVSIEPIDDEDVKISIVPDEASKITTNESGEETELCEAIVLIVENTTDMETEEYIETLETELSSDESTPFTSVISKLTGIIIPETSYADSTDEEYHQYGAIKATLRVIYQKTNQDFVKYIRSSVKINKVKTGATLQKIKLTCHVGASYARSTPSYKSGAGTTIDKKNPKSFSSPSFGSWYQASSPTSLYCYKGGYLCGCNTYATITWKRSGKEYSKTFNLFHSDSIH